MWQFCLTWVFFMIEVYIVVFQQDYINDSIRVLLRQAFCIKIMSFMKSQ